MIVLHYVIIDIVKIWVLIVKFPYILRIVTIHYVNPRYRGFPWLCPKIQHKACDQTALSGYMAGWNSSGYSPSIPSIWSMSMSKPWSMGMNPQYLVDQGWMELPNRCWLVIVMQRHIDLLRDGQGLRGNAKNQTQNVSKNRKQPTYCPETIVGECLYNRNPSCLCQTFFGHYSWPVMWICFYSNSDPDMWPDTLTQDLSVRVLGRRCCPRVWEPYKYEAVP